MEAASCDTAVTLPFTVDAVAPARATTNAATTLRPKSAGPCGGANRSLLITSSGKEQQSRFASKIEGREEEFSLTAVRRRVCTKPRPPSASATLSSNALRRPRPTTTLSCSPAGANQAPQSHSGNPANRADVISPRVMREEIETQRKVSRHAQREYNALHVQRLAKQQDIELLQKHLRAFNVESYSPPKIMRTSPKKINNFNNANCSTTKTNNSTNVNVDTNCSTNTNKTNGYSKPTRADQLKDQIRRVDAYKKTLRHMLERLSRHLQFMRANMELLEAQNLSAAKEFTIFQDKLAQERSLSAELEFKKCQLCDERAAHTTHATQLLESLRGEIQSRSLVSQQRHEADKRRQEMLLMIESRPSTVPTAASSSSPTSTSSSSHAIDRADSSSGSLGGAGGSSSSPSAPLQKRGSASKRQDSMKLAFQESLHFFQCITDDAAADSPDAKESTGPPLAATASSRHLRVLRHHNHQSSVNHTTLSDHIATAMHRETVFHVYETQYERIMARTGESDLVVVLDRYKGFHETIQRLQQIEKDLAAEQSSLESKRSMHQSHLHELTLSGIAEVEKRKKIRDFLEQQHHVKTVLRCQAKEEFVGQLKTFSYVQQGIFNITELLRCLDDKFSPPILTASSGNSSTAAAGSAQVAVAARSVVHKSVRNAAATAELEWLLSLTYSCRSVLKNHCGSSLSQPVEFAVDQIARLGEIDATLGTAAGAWRASQSRHTRVDGSVEQREDRHRGDEEEGDNSERDNEDDDSAGDSDGGDVDDRGRIKRSEAETLAQVDLLFRTLDSRNQLARQEQSMVKLRRAFGLRGISEEPSSDTTTSTTSPLAKPLPVAVDRETKLLAVHAFFKEKRLREKQEQRDAKQEMALMVSTRATRPRTSHIGLTGHPFSSTTASTTTAAMVSADTSQRTSTGNGSAASVALTAFALGGSKTQRKRSNATVSFTLPVSASQLQQQQQQQQQQPSASTAEDVTTRKPTKPPTRPTTATTSSHRPSGGNIQRRQQQPQQQSQLSTQLVRHQKKR